MIYNFTMTFLPSKSTPRGSKKLYSHIKSNHIPPTSLEITQKASHTSFLGASSFFFEGVMPYLILSCKFY